MHKPHKLGEYNGKGDHDEHVQLVNDRIKYNNTNNASKFKLSTLTLMRPTRLWFNGIADSWIESWTKFYNWFTANFTTQKRQQVTIVALRSIMQGAKESMWSYIDRFSKVAVEVKGTEESLQC